jgi:hypothetical protein
MRLGGVSAFLLAVGLAQACGRTIDSSEVMAHAGSSAVGGSQACPCLLIGCSEGYVMRPNPDGCCGTCVLDCEDVACTDQDCQPGSHMEQRAEECCPACVKDDAVPCDEAQKIYQGLRAQLFASYEGRSCLQPTECTILWEYNRCASTCGMPVGLDARDMFDDELSGFAEHMCSRCPAPKPTPCPMPPALSCVDRNCQYADPAPQ